MKCVRRTTLVVSLLALGFLVIASQAHAANISGTISATLTIVDDSRLVGDVTCTVTAARAFLSERQA
jgi:hypothetical protein